VEYRFQDAPPMTHTPRKTETPTTEIVREGHYVAEVDVMLIETDGGWSPYFSLSDAEKIEAVSLALKRSDIAAARRLGGRVYELKEVMA
jgi:hypothetical protein